ncbi:MAG: Response regulator of zinc sigma-54-dependent two-component system [Candidatus Ozemobacter sibiricus]|jgi:DNA-binding NtrC family response regulator|uniref:Response regulator of zinc sigma-54-dependent two-component system n=1 Tax=Candidatus Ozemobacter sibiricus TaxID=2268124 RepID=A0A367ZQ34_9BACT|nr:MAG: Response regulator of zinc sigma-54-dependent two-component system [Candidatus Ozemobacter sibiricus]
MRILVVDDNASLVRGLATFLRQEGHAPATAGSVTEAVGKLAEAAFDLIITDLELPDGKGLEVIRRARAAVPAPEVILMTAYGSVESAVEAMKLGAMDYLTKPVPLEEFAFRIERVARLRQAEARAEVLSRARDTLLERAGLASPLEQMVGRSPEIRHVKETIRKVAAFPSTVLLTGETGTGKEMAARAVHALSPWAEGPFVRVNCASIPESLFEAELFGHEKGAFTDARERRIGRFEAARGGTLFLDEVGEVPLHLQAKLLRALQDKEIVRVGGTAPIAVETRIVAATNRDLAAMVAAGTFREDLLYRLAVVRIDLPPLRRRPEDLPELAEHLLEGFRREFGRPRLRFGPGVLEALARHSWPGNVRELRNAIERAVVLAEGEELSVAAFPVASLVEPRSCEALAAAPEPAAAAEAPAAASGGEGGAEASLAQGLNAALDAFERQLIERALQEAGGVKTRAAALLKISRPNLIYRMKRHGLWKGPEEPGDGV